MWLKLHPSELNLIDIAILPIGLQRLGLGWRGDLRVLLWSRFQLRLNIADLLKELQLFCLLQQQFLLQLFVSFALILQLPFEMSNQPAFVLYFMLINRANPLQLTPSLFQLHLRLLIHLLQPQILLTSLHYLCNLRSRDLIRFFGLRKLIALLLMISHTQHAILNDHDLLIEFLELIDPCHILRLAPLEPHLPQEGKMALNLIPLGWIQMICMHPPQLTFFYLFLKQIPLLQQQIDLPHEFTCSIPSAFVGCPLAWGKQFDTEVGVDGLQLLIALAVSDYFCLDTGAEFVDFALGEVAAAF